MSHDRLAVYLEARLRAATYGCESGVDDNAVSSTKEIPIEIFTENDPREAEL